MRYYSIHFTIDKKIRGSNDYIKNYNLLIPNKNKLYFEEPKFIGNINHTKIDFIPYLLEIELFKKSKVHDLILEGGPVANYLIVSEKLKELIEKYRNHGMQFFNISLIDAYQKHKNYWLLNMYEFSHTYIDFGNSLIYYEKQNADFKISYKIEKTLLKVKNISEFMEYIEMAKIKLENIYIEKLCLKSEIPDDFFALKYVFGSMYYVSEKLKKEIEDAGCTGIEFQPAELSSIEWSHGGEREKIYGKA
ncbi:imm11 family protein [Flavobacterium sp. DG2-3]|uniref:imm11 family protein n=1 Tax=Flavobacterium sp. DG2-3 TaxID=3068317 RepID=UPI00273E9246|nr:DUF1629 domain-containing protein [Flavobacterium sp. DG2-3]MDP5201330.1 hypothetical protein [Flavobacterium sp. DG2-3]